MAGGGSDNSDGSDIFWPGFVDATTNLILNLLFLLTILIVAVFMFALELGRAVGPQDANSDAEVVAEQVVELDAIKENTILKNEIARLQKLLDQQQTQSSANRGAPLTAEGTSTVPTPEKGLADAEGGGFDLTVHFEDDAVSFKDDERARMLEALRPIAATKQAYIVVEVPAGFSEEKRMGFYRSLAVRNLLIELEVPNSNIDVSVIEGSSNADAAVVKVRSE